MLKTPDAVLVRQTLAGRPDRFEALVRRHLRTVYALAMGRVGNPADAEDIAQETFLRAYEKLDTLREPGKFRSWTLTIARRLATDVLRERPPAFTQADGQPAEAATEPDPLRNERNEILRRSLERLDPHKREVLLMHYFAGNSARAIAKDLGISRAAALKRLQRAREQLGEAMVAEVCGAVAPDRPLADQVKDIAKLALASGAAWQLTRGTQATGFAAVATSLLPKSTTILASVVGAALALGAAWMLLTSSDDRPVNADRTQPTPATPLDTPRTGSPPAPPNPRNTQPETQPIALAQAQRADQENADPSAEAESNGEQPETANPLDASVDVEVDDWHIALVLREVEQRVDAPPVQFELDLRAVGGPSTERLLDTMQSTTVRDRRVSGMMAEVNIPRETPLAEAVGMLAAELGLRAVVEPGYIWISSPLLIRSEISRKAPERYAAYDMNLEQPVSLSFTDVHVADIGEFISDTHDVNLFWDFRVIDLGKHDVPAESGSHAVGSLPGVPALPPRKVSRGWIPYVNFRNVELRDALTPLLRALNLHYVPTADYLWISSQQQIRRDGLTPASRRREPAWEKLLSNPVGVVFEDIELGDILEFMSDTYGFNVVLDQRVVAWKAEPAKAVSLLPDDAGSSGYVAVTHGVLNFANFTEYPLGAVLDALLPLIDLTYSVYGDTVYISSPALLNSGEIPDQWLATPKEFLKLLDTPLPKFLGFHQPSPGKVHAMIDFGAEVQSVGPGQTVRGYQVLSISKDAVVLRNTRDDSELRLTP